jgi:mono/diheme cytochrome c family protein
MSTGEVSGIWVLHSCRAGDAFFEQRFAHFLNLFISYGFMWHYQVGGCAMRKGNIWLAAGVIVLAAAAVGQQTQVKRVRVRPPDDTSGAGLYQQYCAVCHGKDGKGGGPAARALVKPPPDLTRISARNGGTFPRLRVERMIAGQDEVTAHGSRDMPIWGPIFHEQAGDKTVGQMRLNSVVSYVEQLQAK